MILVKKYLLISALNTSTYKCREIDKQIHKLNTACSQYFSKEYIINTPVLIYRTMIFQQMKDLDVCNRHGCQLLMEKYSYIIIQIVTKQSISLFSACQISYAQCLLAFFKLSPTSLQCPWPYWSSASIQR